MNKQSKYEQARDEAAYSYDYKEHRNCYGCCQSASDYENAFKAGADWHRDYSQKLNADLFADCKTMRNFIGRLIEVDDRIWGDEANNLYTQLKGKYDE